MPKLAIVIPAYKSMYFKQTLASIAKQNCKDFILYIGNDGGSKDITLIADLFKSQIEIKYIYFNENLGSTNLVAQWERCINLIENEEWIWLFSDDDVMDENCVENFYRELDNNPPYDLFHFNVSRIDEHNNIIQNCFRFPEVYSIEEFLKGRLKGIASSYVVEYIFRKEMFIKAGRFQNFDLGWGSDDATWIKLGQKNGIKTVKNSKVYWRQSPFNISPNSRNTEIINRKLNSKIEFSKWIYTQALENKIQIKLTSLKKYLETWFIETVTASIHFFSFNQLKNLLAKFYFSLGEKKVREKVYLKLSSYKIYFSFKKKLKQLIYLSFKNSENKKSKKNYR